MAAGNLEHAGTAGADPDLRCPAFVGLGVEAGVPQRVELSVEVDGASAFPEQPDHRQRFLEAANRPGEIEAVRQDVLALAAAEAEDETSLCKVIDG